MERTRFPQRQELEPWNESSGAFAFCQSDDDAVMFKLPGVSRLYGG
jgi:hypothetical protein